MNKDLRHLAYEAMRMLRERSPYATGNMHDSIRVEKVKDGGISGGGEYRVIIPADLVPYVVYTNEKWVSPYWKGKSNPNEHWVDKAVQEIVQRLATILDGTFEVNQQEEKDRWENKEFWESPEGQERLRSYENYR